MTNYNILYVYNIYIRCVYIYMHTLNQWILSLSPFFPAFDFFETQKLRVSRPSAKAPRISKLCFTSAASASSMSTCVKFWGLIKYS